MSVPEDSPFGDMGQLNAHFPPSLNQSEDEAEEVEEAYDEEAGDKEKTEAEVAENESEAAAGAKS